MDVYDYLPFDDEDPNSEYSYRLKSTDRFSAFTARADYQVTGWRNADIDIGIQYDNYRIQSIYAIGGDHNYNIGEPITSQSWRGYFSWNFDSLDDSYFPTRGFKYDLMGSACHDTDFHGFFYGARYSLKAALPLGSRVTLIPQTFNRWLFKEGLRYYKNYVGGYLYGRYIPWQMPFVGINNAYKTRDRVDIVRADLRINLFGAHYLTLMSNYMVDWEYVTHYDGQGGKTRLPEVSRNFGAGLSYAINTIVGPIQLCAHWSTLSKSAGFYFSLGCNF